MSDRAWVRWFRVWCAALAIVLPACGGDDDGNGGTPPPTVSSVEVTPPQATIDIRTTTQLSARALDAGGAEVTGETITWSSGSTSVATVSSTGLVTGVGVGTATITATAAGRMGSAQVTVEAVVATVNVTPDPAQLRVGTTVQLAAELLDDQGDPVTGSSVEWSSDDETVVTVDASGLVTGVGLGTTTVRATAEGVEGQAEAQVLPDSFSPDADQDLGGTHDFTEVLIPAGVTVTITDPLTLNVAGPVEIAGTLTGSCMPLAINGESDVTITGTVSTGCSDGETDLPALSVIANGVLTLSDGTIEAPGEVTLSNDPTLDESAFETAAPAPRPGPSEAGARVPACIASNFAFVPMPSQAPNGVDGQDGTEGQPGKTWRLLCRGDAELAGNVRVFGQDGGSGGRGMHEHNVAAEASGGDGAAGGLIRLLATGTWTFSGAGNEAIGGDGGIGGYAEARGLENPDPDAGASAVAVAGWGGEAGLVEIRSLVSIDVSGDLTIRVGDGGSGANALAVGAHGLDATDTKAAQVGGYALAQGGTGGDSPDKMLTANGAIAGLGNVTVAGGNGGGGGDGMADAGDGGWGSEQFIHGADGGDIYDNVDDGAIGGDGGHARITDTGGGLIGDGGDGGMALVVGGNGGTGFDGCSVSPVKPGGDGGWGGYIRAKDGAGGTGLNPGGPGGITVEDFTGLGGNGEDGEPSAGLKGEKGIDAIAPKGARTDSGNNFKDGTPGTDCHSGFYDLIWEILSDPSGHDPYIGIRALLEVFIALSGFQEDGSATFQTETGAPWVNVLGTRAPDGAVQAEGRGVVAGYSNILVILSGILRCDGTFDFEYTMGADGGLPGGQAITYGIAGTMPSAAAAAPVIRSRPRYGSPAAAPPQTLFNGGCR